MADSPTTRTKRKWQKAGYLVAVVEHWNPHARIRQDMFGLWDLVALGDGEIVFIQTTSRGNISARVRKIESDDHAKALAACRKSGARLIVEGWGKMASGRWECREVDIS